MKNIQFTTAPDSIVDSTWRLGTPVLGVQLTGVVHLDDESLSSESIDGHRYYAKLSPDVGEKIQALLCESVMASLRLVDGGTLTDAPADAIVEIRANMSPSIDVAFIFPRGTYGSIGGSTIAQGSLLCITAHDGVVTITVERGGGGGLMVSWALSRTESARVVAPLIAGLGEAVQFLRGVEAGM